MRPLLWISLAFLIGIATAQAASLPVSLWIMLAVITLVLGILWRFLTNSLELTSLARGVTSATLFLIFLFLGAVRYQAAVPVFDASDLGWYNDRGHDSLVTGWVSEPPDRRDKFSNLRVQVTSIDAGDGTDIEVDGTLLARVGANEEVQYGEVVRVRGELQTPI